jgi:single-strand DNA-binding protein
MMQMACHGRLGGDPKPIQTAKGTSMAVVTMAVNVPDRGGEEHTEWLGLVCFGRVADQLLQHAKGDLISVAGRAQHNSYTTSSGETREQLQIIADSIVSARTVRPGGGRKKQSTKGEAEPAAASSNCGARGDDGAPFDDEIQF